MAALEDHEARVAASTVLVAVNALGANQREMAETLRGHTATLADHGRRLASVEPNVDDTNQRVRSLEVSTAKIKDLLVRALDQ